MDITLRDVDSHIISVISESTALASSLNGSGLSPADALAFVCEQWLEWKEAGSLLTVLASAPLQAESAEREFATKFRSVVSNEPRYGVLVELLDELISVIIKLVTDLMNGCLNPSDAAVAREVRNGTRRYRVAVSRKLVHAPVCKKTQSPSQTAWAATSAVSETFAGMRMQDCVTIVREARRRARVEAEG